MLSGTVKARASAADIRLRTWSTTADRASYVAILEVNERKCEESAWKDNHSQVRPPRLSLKRHACAHCFPETSTLRAAHKILHFLFVFPRCLNEGVCCEVQVFAMLRINAPQATLCQQKNETSVNSQNQGGSVEDLRFHFRQHFKLMDTSPPMEEDSAGRESVPWRCDKRTKRWPCVPSNAF